MTEDKNSFSANLAIAIFLFAYAFGCFFAILLSLFA